MERLLHPVVDAVRTPEGRLRSIQPLEPDRALAGQRESLIFIEMDRTAARNRAELAIEIEQVLDEVRCAVGGWKPILARLRSDTRSEERRVGKGCVSTCRSRWSQYH